MKVLERRIILFDTVRLQANFIKIDIEKLISNYADTKKYKIKTYYDSTLKQVNYTFILYDERIPYIRYFQNSESLLIQLSIPKFLYGSNINLVTERDIDRFWEDLINYLNVLLDIDFNSVQWKVTRIDICWNYKVGNLVSDYILCLSKKRFPYKDTVTYNHLESVVFSNRSSRITFYDKQKEVIRNRHSSEDIEKAKGILRLEITPSSNDIKCFSSDKDAKKLLSKTFFEIITKKALQKLLIYDDKHIFDIEWLSKQNITQVETSIGFTILNNILGETTMKGLYKPATYKNRNTLLKSINFPINKTLPKLDIDYAEIG